VAQYAVALLVPSLGDVARLILAYVVANRLGGGLRVLSRSPGLRRAVGGGEVQTRLAHLAVPTLGTALWWLTTAPAAGNVLGRLDLVLVAGVAAAVYRSATRPPLSHGGFVMETPFGLFPVEMVLQMARGPDVLGATIVLQWIAGR
jgi:hypothetical protein